MTLVHKLSLLSGDHPYADLADVTLHHGWHTGAVIRELEAEIVQMNTDQFKWGVNWIQVRQSSATGARESKSGHLKPSLDLFWGVKRLISNHHICSYLIWK